MKKKLLALFIVFCFSTQTCFGAMLKIVENEISYRLQKAPGSSIKIETLNPDIIDWKVNTGNVSLGADGSFVMPETDVEIEAVYAERWNAPVIKEGLTPVNWNGSSWVTTDEANWDYNYKMATTGHGTVAGDGTAKWANAQTSDGSLYVWIPRYSYRITSGEHESGNSWSSVDNPGTNRIKVKFSEGTEDYTMYGYIPHPAFSFGGDQLKGIWVAKYEASRNDATSSSEGSGTTVSFKPGVVSWGNLSVSNMYDYSYNLNRSLDSHLMKNSEWGAVAYLTNAVGKIPYINNSSSYITGNAGGSQDAGYAGGTINAWNTAGGVKASTTHNVYGIYDMSGGADEYVSAYYEGGESSYLADDTTNKTYAGSLYTNRTTKYVEIYSTAYDSSKKGDAVYETSSADAWDGAWDGDSASAPSSYYPVFKRGGMYSLYTSISGVFGFDSYDGSTSTYDGFRTVLSPQDSEPSVHTVMYDTNGGTGVPDSQVKHVGTDLTLTSTEPTRDGYSFLGWSTNSSATTAEYLSGSTFTIDADTTLYAVWSADAYTITYNLDGGTVTGNPSAYTIESDDITLVNPTKATYTFKGWTGSNGETPSTSVTIAKGSTGNKEYTANWELNKYDITFNKNGGTGTMSNQSFTHGVAQNLTSNAFTREGYTFKGWATSSTATTATYTDGSSYTATEAKTLYAVWQINTYTVTITGTGSSSYSYVTINGTKYTSATTLTVNYGTTITCYTRYGLKLNGTSQTLSSYTYTYTVKKNVSIKLAIKAAMTITD